MSSLDICNSALIRLGVDPISSLLEESKAAVLCNAQYDRIRKKLLYSHPWNFAIKRLELTPEATQPEFGFAYEYELPSDFLRLLSVKYPDIPYKVEGNLILSDDGALKIVYIRDEDDTSVFNAGFAELLSLTLALNLSYSLVQSTGLVQRLQEEIQTVLRDMRSFDAQENPGKQIVENTFLNARW